MNIGIVCYASIGGSGIIATELGKALASRGHRVHVLSSDMPVRLGDYQPGLSFHRVETPSYPLFREPQYLLSLANKIVQVARARAARHRPRALRDSARDGRVSRAADPGVAAAAPAAAEGHHDAARHRHHAARQRSVVLGDRGVLHRAVRRRHGGVREPQGGHASASWASTRDIRVIPNFLDCSVHRRRDVPDLRERFARPDEKLVIHVSNFRPVKRVDGRGRGLRAHPQRGPAPGC